MVNEGLQVAAELDQIRTKFDIDIPDVASLDGPGLVQESERIRDAFERNQLRFHRDVLVYAARVLGRVRGIDSWRGSADAFRSAVTAFRDAVARDEVQVASALFAQLLVLAKNSRFKQYVDAYKERNLLSLALQIAQQTLFKVSSSITEVGSRV